MITLYQKAERQAERIKRKNFRALYRLVKQRIRTCIKLGRFQITINPTHADLALDHPYIPEYMREIKKRIYNKYGNQLHLVHGVNGLIYCTILGGK